MCSSELGRTTSLWVVPSCTTCPSTTHVDFGRNYNLKLGACLIPACNTKGRVLDSYDYRRVSQWHAPLFRQLSPPTPVFSEANLSAVSMSHRYAEILDPWRVGVATADSSTMHNCCTVSLTTIGAKMFFARWNRSRPPIQIEQRFAEALRRLARTIGIQFRYVLEFARVSGL